MPLLKKIADHICYIELNSETLNNQTIGELIHFFKTTDNSLQHQSVVLSAKNGVLFDQPQPEDETDASLLTERELLFTNLFEAMSLHPRPIILKMDKGAGGRALGILLYADIVLASTEAFFDFQAPPKNRVSTSFIQDLMSRFGSRLSRYLIFSGQKLNSEQALQLNLIHQVHPIYALAIKTREIALRTNKFDSSVVAQFKELTEQ